MTTNNLVRFGAAAIAIAAIVGFTFMYSRAILLGWNTPDKKVEHNPEYVYVATALAGLVGGVFAMVFKVEPPPANPQQAAVAVVNSNDGTTESTPTNDPPVVNRGTRILHALNPLSHQKLLDAMTAIYAIAYFSIGVAAIATWVRLGANTADLVKNVALISIGLFLAIARTFFVPPA